MLAFAFTIPALWLMGRKDKRCFILFTVVNVLFVYVGCKNGLYGLVGMSVIYMVFNVRNYLMWRRQEGN